MNKEAKLAWEAITTQSGGIIQAARLEDTPDGWECTAVRVPAGVEFARKRVDETLCITITEGQGCILHNNEFKIYEPNKRYLFAAKQLFMLHATEDTLLALTCPK